MPGNPLIALGSLNRLKASVLWTNFPQLNVTPSYLGTAGIRLSLEGNATTMLNTMTGRVTSPEPYMPATINIALIKTQQLADLYKTQMELSCVLGDCTVRPDVQGSGGIGYYQLTNMAIESIGELSFAGTEAGYMVNLQGYYLINSALWDG